MAKQGTEVNKSALVREVLSANPTAEVKDVVKELAAKGHKVQSSLVYVVRAKMRRKKRRQARDKATHVVSNSGDPIGTIRKVKALAVEVGGIGKLKTIVELLAE